MIDVKQATKTALDFFQSLPLDHDKISGLQLEEVELSEDGKYWFITLGYRLASPLSTGALVGVLGTPKPSTEYKEFKIHAESAEVQAMKIRHVS